jgi:hypothetical protein
LDITNDIQSLTTFRRLLQRFSLAAQEEQAACDCSTSSRALI